MPIRTTLRPCAIPNGIDNDWSAGIVRGRVAIDESPYFVRYGDPTTRPSCCGREDVGLNFIPCRFGKLTLAMLLVQLADLLAGVGAASKWRGPGPSGRTWLPPASRLNPSKNDFTLWGSPAAMASFSRVCLTRPDKLSIPSNQRCHAGSRSTCPIVRHARAWLSSRRRLNRQLPLQCWGGVA